MLAVLVLPVWLCLFARLRARGSDWRDALLAACTIWGMLVVAVTESLSLVGELAYWPMVAAWLLISVAAVAGAFRSRPRHSMAGARAFLRDLPDNPWQRLLLAGVLALIALIAVAALVAPPNNWDSMTYHMTRVMNWMDHRTVSHYPAHNLRQLYLAPWAEFAVLQLQLLSGGDRFAACVQLVSMIGSVIGVSRIAGRLGASTEGQLFASVCCATVPMGILQGASTQNDYVTAFWLLCFVNGTLALANDPTTWETAWLTGASLGLMALTKTSGLLFAAPFALWMGAALCRQHPRRVAGTLTMIAAAATVLNAPHLLRNHATFGSWLEPPDEAIYQNRSHSPAAVVSSAARNLAVHAAGLPRGAGIAMRAVLRIHRVIGIDADDRRTTFETTHFPALGFPLHEDRAGNPVHLLLGALVIAACLWRAPAGGGGRFYALSLCAGFVLFCALLKWQPWVSRLQLPLFAATAPLMGVVFSATGLRRTSVAVGVVLLLLGLAPALGNNTKPLVGRRASVLRLDRTSLYFEDRPLLKAPYVAAAAELSRTPQARVGLITGIDSWEYPLRRLVQEAAPTVRFEYVNVENSSTHAGGSSASAAEWPATIVTIDRADLDPQLRGTRQSIPFGPIQIYRPR